MTPEFMALPVSDKLDWLIEGFRENSDIPQEAQRLEVALEIKRQLEPLLSPGNWRPLVVDLRIDGVVRKVTVLAIDETAPKFTVL